MTEGQQIVPELDPRGIEIAHDANHVYDEWQQSVYVEKRITIKAELGLIAREHAEFLTESLRSNRIDPAETQYIQLVEEAGALIGREAISLVQV